MYLTGSGELCLPLPLPPTVDFVGGWGLLFTLSVGHGAKIMHVGKVYPYLFEYWATEWLFWPHYCPRELTFTRTLPSSGWDIITINTPQVAVFDHFLAGTGADPVFLWVDPGGAGEVTVTYTSFMLLGLKWYKKLVRCTLTNGHYQEFSSSLPVTGNETPFWTTNIMLQVHADLPEFPSVSVFVHGDSKPW